AVRQEVVMLLVIGGHRYHRRRARHSAGRAKTAGASAHAESQKKNAASLPSGVEAFVGDLQDEVSLVAAMRGVERFFLITGDTQHDGNALSAAAKAGVKHVVKISTQEAGFTPVRGHGHKHREREELIARSGLTWTLLRPTMLMNLALTWARDIRANG